MLLADVAVLRRPSTKQGPSLSGILGASEPAFEGAIEFDMSGEVARKRCRVSVASLACACALAPLTWTPRAGASSMQVATKTVCFEVHNGLSQSRVFGTRFRAANSSLSRVIVLIHGVSGNRSVWDLKPSYSVARRLARAGYLVIAYDLLTAGASTYPAGNTVTFEADRDMLAEIVQQIRGTYPLPTAGAAGPCPAGEAPGIGSHAKVILIGHSGGGALVGGYPGKWGKVTPVDAVVQDGFSNAGTSDEAVRVIGAKLDASANIKAGQLSVFLDDGSTRTSSLISPVTCTENRRLLLYPGIRTAPDLDGIACASSSFETVPYIFFVSIANGAMAGNRSFIAMTDPNIPVLLAFSDHDAFFPTNPALSTSGTYGCGSAGCQTAEHDYWIANCPCARHVTTWTERNSGHVFQWSSTMPDFTNEVVNWLKAVGIR